MNRNGSATLRKVKMAIGEAAYEGVEACFAKNRVDIAPDFQHAMVTMVGRKVLRFLISKRGKALLKELPVKR